MGFPLRAPRLADDSYRMTLSGGSMLSSYTKHLPAIARSLATSHEREPAIIHPMNLSPPAARHVARSIVIRGSVPSPREGLFTSPFVSAVMMDRRRSQ
jgi:hypothetical protein